jgi:hypothetical protein
VLRAGVLCSCSAFEGSGFGGEDGPGTRT